jgi:ABC-type phosphate transport system permease subunit
MRGFVCAWLLGLAAALAEGAPVMLAANLPGQVESW